MVKKEISGRVMCRLRSRTVGSTGSKRLRGLPVVIVCLVQPETRDKLDSHTNCRVIWPEEAIETTSALISPVGFRKVWWCVCVWAVQHSDLSSLLYDLGKCPLSETQCPYLLWEQHATEKRSLHKIVLLAHDKSLVSEQLVKFPPQECDLVTGANGFPPFQWSPRGPFSQNLALIWAHPRSETCRGIGRGVSPQPFQFQLTLIVWKCLALFLAICMC